MDDTTTLTNEQTAKVQQLRNMILTAERTILSAKAMLLSLEGKKKTGRPRKVEEIDGGEVVEGAFDGQYMQGSNGKQYPVPANYASKSKLIQGDHLKLTITPDGSFIYKQVGPIDRRQAIGIVVQDTRGVYQILIDGKLYRTLLASVTFYKAEVGDEVAVILPRDFDAQWASIEGIVSKNSHENWVELQATAETAKTDIRHDWKADLSTTDDETTTPEAPSLADVVTDAKTETAVSTSATELESWIADMEKLEKELASETTEVATTVPMAEETPASTPADSWTSDTPTTATASSTSALDDWLKDMEKLEKELDTKSVSA
jgi:hypothetical protein